MWQYRLWVYNAEIFFVASGHPFAPVIRPAKQNSKKVFFWDTLVCNVIIWFLRSWWILIGFWYVLIPLSFNWFIFTAGAKSDPPGVKHATIAAAQPKSTSARSFVTQAKFFFAILFLKVSGKMNFVAHPLVSDGQLKFSARFCSRLQLFWFNP